MSEGGKTSDKNSGVFYLIEILRIQWYGGCQDNPAKVNDKLYLAPPTTKTEAQHPVGLCGFGG